MTLSSSMPLDSGDSSSPPAPEPDALTLQQDLEAVRIQVAAVMAQQVALTEKEGELDQRRIEFQRQEKQLAGHLEARTLKLNELHERIRADRQHLIEQKAAWKTQQKTHLAELAEDRKAARDAESKADAERHRLQALRRRLRKRWKQNFALEQVRLRAGQDQILKNQKEQQQQSEELSQTARALAQERLAFNTSVELGKRELQDAWSALHVHKRQEQEKLTSERLNLEKRTRALEHGTSALARDVQLLADQQNYWQQRKSHLERECEGLENRVRNLRSRLADDRHALPTFMTPATSGWEGEPPGEPGVAARQEPRPPDRERIVGRLSASLADQRLVLFEQVERLLAAWQGWLSEHASVETELTNRTTLLQEREQSLAVCDRVMDGLSAELQQRHSTLVGAKERLEAKQAELRVEEIQLAKERNCLFAVERAREEQIAAYRAHLVDLRRRWLGRRRQELKAVREELARCETIRSQLITILQANSQRSSSIECEARRLAEKALALEEYKLETLGQAPDAARAEQRIRRLRRRWSHMYAASERRVLRERQVLVNEAARLDQLGKHLGQQAEKLVSREAELFDQQTNRETGEVKVEELLAKQVAEIGSLRIHLQMAERQTGQLGDEIERLIHVLIPDDSPPALSLIRAA
jgi:hypothetical protein